MKVYHSSETHYKRSNPWEPKITHSYTTRKLVSGPNNVLFPLMKFANRTLENTLRYINAKDLGEPSHIATNLFLDSTPTQPITRLNYSLMSAFSFYPQRSLWPITFISHSGYEGRVRQLRVELASNETSVQIDKYLYPSTLNAALLDWIDLGTVLTVRELQSPDKYLYSTMTFGSVLKFEPYPYSNSLDRIDRSDPRIGKNTQKARTETYLSRVVDNDTAFSHRLARLDSYLFPTPEQIISYKNIRPVYKRDPSADTHTQLDQKIEHFYSTLLPKTEEIISHRKKKLIHEKGFLEASNSIASIDYYTFQHGLLQLTAQAIREKREKPECSIPENVIPATFYDDYLYY